MLQSETASLQQKEQDALARIGMLEAELQHVRNQTVPAAEADTVASTEVEDSALAAESPIASATETPPPPGWSDCPGRWILSVQRELQA